MLKNIPNFLSLFRIILVPFFVIAYLSDPNDVKIGAIIIYATAMFTDFLDGYIARKFDTTSNLGRILDPIGDKLLNISVLTCIAIEDLIPWWMVIVVLCKELLMFTGGALIHRKAKMEIPPSNYCGKASTVVFFIVCVIILLFKNISDKLIIFMLYVAILLAVAALFSYIRAYRTAMHRAKE